MTGPRASPSLMHRGVMHSESMVEVAGTAPASLRFNNQAVYRPCACYTIAGPLCQGATEKDDASNSG